MLELFSKASIDFIKTPASCSAICQASDASNFFKAAKQKLAHLPLQAYGNEVLPYEDRSLEARLMAFVATRESFSSAKKGQIVMAMLKVAWIVRTTLTDKEIVKSGYATIGQYPLSFENAMKWVSMDIPKNAYKHMENKVEEIANIYRTKGILTEEDMDAANIISIDLDHRSKPKDQRVLHQQRAVIMNSEECVRRFQAYHDEKTLGRKMMDKQVYINWFESLTADEQVNEAKLQKYQGKKVRYATIAAMLSSKQPSVESDQSFLAQVKEK